MKKPNKKQYRLISSLKLHNRIVESSLREVAIDLVGVSNTLFEKYSNIMSNDDKQTLVAGIDRLINTGQRCDAVIKKSKLLQYNSTQEELKDLFDLIVKPIKSNIDKPVKDCHCTACCSKRNKTKEDNIPQEIKDLAKSVYDKLGVESKVVSISVPQGASSKEVAAIIAEQILKAKNNKGK